MMKHHLLSIIFFLILTQNLFAQSELTRTYKEVNGQELCLKCFIPDGPSPEEGYPAIVFFFGGGWNSGTVDQFKKQAAHLTSLGMVTIRADYRTKNNAGTTPIESVMDAKSAMRYVKEHAEEFKVNIHKLAASGGSAGGHLAAATCYIKAFNDANDNLAISPRPTALVLFNPVIDNSEKGYGYNRVKDFYMKFSPLHNIENPVPTIFFLGKKDQLIPVSTSEAYKEKCESLGGRCDLKLYDNCVHGFFNVTKYKETLQETIKFLQSIHYLK